MYIVNKHGILHSWPDGQPLPKDARPAQAWEVEQFQATGEQNTAKMTKPKTKKGEDSGGDKPTA